jgi:hypothetical protein
MAVTSSEAGSVVRYAHGSYGSTPHPPWVFCTCRSGQALASTSTIIRPARALSPNEMKLTGRAACKSMSRAQEHLAQANGHIAALKVQIVRQRVIVKYTLDMGQPSEMAESMLHALEESLSAFEKHRELVLYRLKH